MLVKNQKNKQIIILILVSLLQMSLSAILLNNLSMENWSVIYAEDSQGYLLVARYFLGEELPSSSLPLLKYRLFSPVVPFIASFLARIFSLRYTFLFLNLLFWLISVYLIYRFSKNLLNQQLAYYCALLFTTSLPLIVWGLPIMVDMAAFFFAILFCLEITHLSTVKRSRFLIIALTLPLAILTKPNLISLLLFFILYDIFQEHYVRIPAVLIITLILVGGVYLYLDLRLEDFLAYGYLRHQGFFYVLNSLVFCFHWGGPLAVWGFYLERGHRKFYLTYLASTFGCYLLFVHNPRLMFVVYPAVLPLAVRGMEASTKRIANLLRQKPERIIDILVLVYIITSNVLTVLYLFITRVLQCRSIESLKQLLGF